MRLAFISTMQGFSWGGSEELWYLIVKKALTDNHEVFVFVFDNQIEPTKLKDLRSRGAIISKRKTFAGGGGIGGRIINNLQKKISLKLSLNLSKALSARPQAVCINLAYSYHLLEQPELRKYLDKIKTGYGLICQGHKDLPFTSNEYRLIVKKYFEKALWIAFVSNENKESTERHLAIRLPQAFVVNNPANLTRLDYLPYPDNNQLQLATVARFDAVQKGHDLLFEVLSKPEWKSRNWVLNLVGSGPQEDYFRELVKFYDLEKKVNFQGQVSDLKSVWKSQQVLLLPSRFEGTPLSLIEAMLCGRTAVVTDVGGNAEWITNEYGFVAEAPSVKYISQALERMWENRDSLEEYGKRCREIALSKFDMHAADKLLLKMINPEPK